MLSLLYGNSCFKFSMSVVNGLMVFGVCLVLIMSGLNKIHPNVDVWIPKGQIFECCGNISRGHAHKHGVQVLVVMKHQYLE